jgi:hypothetical protein
MTNALQVNFQKEFRLLSKSSEVYGGRILDRGLEYEAYELEAFIREELKLAIKTVEHDEKTFYKEVHSKPRNVALQNHQRWLTNNWHKYSEYFALPTEVFPEKISPRLELVEKQKQLDLFRIARLTWNLPYSRGYGRRLNYLIWDDSNERLMGVLGLQSAPISLPARDKKYHIPKDNKDYIVNLTMDAFTLGSLPPYSDLLAGKLVVLAAASKEIRQDYKKRYTNRKTEIMGRVLPSNLVAITTLSAFGRSSIYNRVSKGVYSEGFTEAINGEEIVIRKGDNIWATESLGPCEGWGTIHFSDVLYEKMKAFHHKLLPEKRLSGFGVGPRIRQQVIKRVLRELRLPETFAKHNLKREVFVIPHVDNLEDVLSGRSKKPKFNDQHFQNLANYWRERYCLQRSESRCSLEGRQTVKSTLGVLTDN